MVKKEIILSFSEPVQTVWFIGGLLIGGMMPYLFSSLVAEGVGKVAFKIIEEVRRQFREIKGLAEGKVMPDSSKCVDIAAIGALKSMMLPGVIAIIVPIIIGVVFGPVPLAGVLVGTLVVGLQLGIQTANSGAALDNAKKYIEEGNFGGKGSFAHKAAVIGDTVGDPMKDAMGPSINILIKLMAIISLVLAPLIM
jgi:K(+)-stimulated pyrophosphate-energized sodium pump